MLVAVLHASITVPNAATPVVVTENRPGSAHRTPTSSNSDTDDTQYSLQLSVPIFSGGAAASRTRQTKSLRQAAGLDRQAAERQLREFRREYPDYPLPEDLRP